uniref:Uncharacterized protein n=1 Tax=Tanacetum cinerariifolium TaxID=118510 RepID=A0A6L2N076_TANCI|nr:hypothetical protein [Tanacetum cinerariifolium]
MADSVFLNCVPVSLDHAPLPPQRDIVMTNATIETTALEFAAPDQEGEQNYEIGESSYAAQVHPITGDLIHHTISLILARLVCHDDTIDRLCDQFDEVSLDRMEVIEHDVETLQTRVSDVEERAGKLQLTLEEARTEIQDL